MRKILATILMLALLGADSAIAQLQPFANYQGLLMNPNPTGFAATSANNGTLDAAGESFAGVGYVNLSTGPGTSATMCSGGCGNAKIHWVPGTTTFNNGSTVLRIGINDVSTATGLEDGTHDVFDDITQGVETITANAVNTAVMSSGSVTIDHGDLIAIVVEMTARGGADSVVVTGAAHATTHPYATADTGAGPAKTASGAPKFTLEFDDGTLGWLTFFPAFIIEQQTAYGTGSNPDEYALVFEVPFTAVVTGLWADIDAVTAGDDFEMILYSDPLGTPAAECTIVQDPDVYSTSAVFWTRDCPATVTLQPDTKYAIALRPTTANTMSFGRLSFGSGNGNLRGVTQLGTNWSQYTREGNTGAFGSESTHLLPLFGVWISEMHDGAGSSRRTIIGGN